MTEADVKTMPWQPASADSPVPAGERYLLGECIGEGGMGRVFKARDLVLDRDVAVKRFRGGSDVDPGAARRHQAELRIVAGLSHPHLTVLLDYLDDDHSGAPALVMELVPGPSLAARIEDGPLPARDAAELGA